jgi:hypothetical protein
VGKEPSQPLYQLHHSRYLSHYDSRHLRFPQQELVVVAAAGAGAELVELVVVVVAVVVAVVDDDDVAAAVVDDDEDAVAAAAQPFVVRWLPFFYLGHSKERNISK